MAKAYEFRISLQQASFDGQYASIVFGGRETTYYTEDYTGTLQDALARRIEVSKSEIRPHAAFLSMKYRNDRKPPKFDSLSKPIYGPKE